jgi:hypothetical protein
MDLIPIRKNAGFRPHSGPAPEASCPRGRLYHTIRHSRRPVAVAVVLPTPLDAGPAHATEAGLPVGRLDTSNTVR